VRHTDIRLKLDCIVQPSFDIVDASKRMTNNCNASALNIPLCDTDAFILHTKLCEKTSLNIALKKSRINMDITNKLTTFKERITHTVYSY
jgi:hypothetical protein